MLRHGHVLIAVLDIIIIPVVKSKSGDITDKKNYIPMSIATAMSKVIELVILDTIKLYIYTTDNQFGVKKGHSTDMCILYAFKQTINNIGETLVRFLDAI